MIQLRDAYMNASDFDFQLNRNNILQISFGPTHICMTLDAAYDLQYYLVAFLAQQELKDYPVQVENDDVRLAESRRLLELLISNSRNRGIEN